MREIVQAVTDFKDLTPKEIMAILQVEKDQLDRVNSIPGMGRYAVTLATQYVGDLNAALSGRQIHVDSATVFGNPHLSARWERIVKNEVLAVHGVYLQSKGRSNSGMSPYALINPESVRGIWLDQTEYRLLEAASSEGDPRAENPDTAAVIDLKPYDLSFSN